MGDLHKKILTRIIAQLDQALLNAASDGHHDLVMWAGEKALDVILDRTKEVLRGTPEQNQC